MCSILGVIAIKPADPNEILAYSKIGGQYLQHRGHEWVGVAFSDGKFVRVKKHQGLVVSLFGDKDIMADITAGTPQMFLMQTRFSTQGRSDKRNAQPHWRRPFSGAMVLGSNGDVCNYTVERERLEKNGAKLISENDSEILLLNIMHRSENNPDHLHRGIVDTMENVQASYSAWLATEDTVHLFRDPYGNRPLYYMQVGDFFIFASEDCALDAVLNQRATNNHQDGTVEINQVLPGEIIKVNLRGEIEHLEGVVPKSPLAKCAFERIYFARPDSTTFSNDTVPENRLCYKVVINWDKGRYDFTYINRGEGNNDFRGNLGQQLAREFPPESEADCVIAVPASGNFAALGYAEQSGLPFKIGLVRSPYITRTFLSPGLEHRQSLAALKYRALPELFAKYPRVVIVDDSIVYGTTIQTIVRMCYAAGAKEIHVRISCPPIISPCRLGIDMSSKGSLEAAEKSVEEIRQMLNATSLRYLSLDGLRLILGEQADQFCFACWTGKCKIGN